MIHLIYVSSATQKMSESDLFFLLEQSRNRNERLNITGMLLFAGGNFFQILEGPEKDVGEVYESIMNDNRNTNNIIMRKKEITERNFPDWSMGFKHWTDRGKITVKGYSEFMDREMTPHEFSNKPGRVIEMLYEFKKNCPT